MTLSIKKLRDDAQIPHHATPDSAGIDLYSCLDSPVTIAPKEIVKIPTGLAVSPSRRDVALCIFPRSGLSSKHGITLINSVGLVDSDYRGELILPLINHGTEPFTIENGMRLAQLVCIPILHPTLVETDSLDETIRGENAFGASGIH